MTGEPSLDVFSATEEWAQNNRIKLWSRAETGSTNSIAKDDEAAATAPENLAPGEPFCGPSLYLARTQTQGRGRGSHTWTTPPGNALLSSWSFALAQVPQPIFSALVGLALYNAATKTWPTLPWNLKAPNDLFLDRKKTAGILIETIDSGARKRTVIGLGFNVLSAPQEVESATCLKAHLPTGQNVSARLWQEFLNAWLTELRAAVLEGCEERLSATAAENLTAALALHPLLAEPLLRVDFLGQLHFASRVVHWHDL